MEVTICLPTNRGLKPKTLESLMNMVKGKGYKVLLGTKGFTTAENRTWLTVKAIKEGATHLFFADDDMVYAEDTIEKLLEADKDIIGAAYANRRGDGDVIGETIEGDEVTALGGGCTLVRKEVFEAIPQPWFSYKTDPSGMVTMSHDWFFCEKARDNGFKVYAHPDLRPAHINSDYEY